MQRKLLLKFSIFENKTWDGLLILIQDVSRCFHSRYVVVKRIFSITYHWFYLRTRKRSRADPRGHSHFGQSSENVISRNLTFVVHFTECRTVWKYWELSLCKKPTIPNTENRKTALAVPLERFGHVLLKNHFLKICFFLTLAITWLFCH